MDAIYYVAQIIAWAQLGVLIFVGVVALIYAIRRFNEVDEEPQVLPKGYFHKLDESDG